MGDLVRPSAGIKEIIKDVRTTLTNAIAKGGLVRERAEQGIGPVLAMNDAAEAELEIGRAVLTPLHAAVRMENESADDTIDRVYDDTWNDVGRPAHDRYLSLMFPGGADYYTDGDTPGQPARMELLARLYDRKLHPKLDPAKSTAYAVRIREAAAALKADIDAAAAPAANVALLEQVLLSLARSAQFDLASLKRTYKNDGMTEAAIHTIIPDRPVAKKAAKKAEAKKPEAEKPEVKKVEATKPEAEKAEATPEAEKPAATPTEPK